jgi:OOP family OmpA-OmpF porin
LISIAAVSALLLCTSVQAQGFVGAAGGWSRIGIDCTGLSSCDKTHTGFKAFGGYRFGSPLAVEVTYFDWGRATGAGTLSNGAGGTLAGTGKLAATGYGIGLAYFTPVANDWNVALRLGVARNKGKVTASDNAGSVEDSRNATSAYAGLGFGFQVDKNLTLTAEADFSRVKYGLLTIDDKANVQLISIGLRYAF